VKYIVHSAATLRHRIEIKQVGFAEIDLIDDFRKILASASGKIVNPAYFVALGQYSASERRADESGNTRDQISSHTLFYPMREAKPLVAI